MKLELSDLKTVCDCGCTHLETLLTDLNQRIKSKLSEARKEAAQDITSHNDIYEIGFHDGVKSLLEEE